MPSFYHKQWVPEYLNFVQFRYDRATYQIRLRQHRQKVFFVEGLKHLRKDLEIFESVTINFFACDDKSTFDLHFTPSLDNQTCGRPRLSSREHVWMLEITQSMLGAPKPLVTITSCSLFLIQIAAYI